MLLPYTTLAYYGAGAGAMVDTQPDTTPSLSIKADKRLSASIQGGQIEPYLKMTRALIQYLNVTGLGELHSATWKKNARMDLNVSIGATPSAFDIAQAVWLQNASAVNVAGTTGQKINAAASAGDPWTTDLTTYSDGTAGFKLNSLQNGVSGSSAISTLALGRTLNVGVETNTYVDTQQLNGVYHTIDDVANVIDVEYQFNVTSNGTPVEVTLFANLQSANDSMIVYSWDYLTSGWIQAGTLLGTGSSSLSEYKYILFRRSVDTNGDVRIRLVGGSSNPRLDIDLIYVSYSVSLTASDVWNKIIETGVTAEQVLKLLSSVAAGKSSITDLGGGNATVVFRDINDTSDRVTASMANSERTSVTKNL